ncbi:hypothetical protein AB0L75_05550 [Streptomyces sp. NPDC052101]|uniref:hypothetical protein n=1 Tax=Streptomyces sp. NPDC052101 TaxID=3155763 RepID=UPI00343BF7B7
MSIIHALLRRALDVFAPGTGRRRATARLTTPAPVDWADAPRTSSPTLPAQRSPYGRDVPLDGHASVMVRPYVLAVEREWEREHERERALRRHRRLALVLAMDFGIDLDRHVIGAEGLAR